MNSKNKVALTVALAQLGAQVARLFQTRQAARTSGIKSRYGRVSDSFSERASDMHDKLPHRRRQQHERKVHAAIGIGAAVAALAAGAAAFFARRRPVDQPSALQKVKQKVDDGEVAKAIVAGASQGVSNVAAGAGSTAASVATVAQVAVHEKVVEPVEAQVKKYSLIAVLVISAVVIISTTIGALLASGILSWFD